MPPYPDNFLFLVGTGFLHVVQAGLELLTSGNPLTSDSQSAGITDYSVFFYIDLLLIKYLLFISFSFYYISPKEQLLSAYQNLHSAFSNA